MPAEFITAIYEFAIIIFSLCVHESAHAWMASRLGDQTARMQGRITLNPAYHVDPVGTLLIPGLMLFGPFIGLGYFSRFLIGWAKPVQVNTRNFAKIRRDENLVSMAGPASNILLAFLAFLGLLAIKHLAPGSEQMGALSMDSAIDMAPGKILITIVTLLTLAIFINLSLCFFNLLPVPPLDGSHVLRNMLPYNAAQAYDRIPIFVSYILLFALGGRFVGLFMRPMVRLLEWGLTTL